MQQLCKDMQKQSGAATNSTRSPCDRNFYFSLATSFCWLLSRQDWERARLPRGSESAAGNSHLCKEQAAYKIYTQIQCQVFPHVVACGVLGELDPGKVRPSRGLASLSTRETISPSEISCSVHGIGSQLFLDGCSRSWILLQDLPKQVARCLKVHKGQ